MKMIVNGLAAGIITTVGCNALAVPAVVAMIIVVLAIFSAEMLVACG